MARKRAPEPPKRPIWHPSRFGWANGLGFALGVFLALFIMGVAGSALLGRSEPLTFSFPAIYAYASMATLLILVGFTCVLIFGVAWKGADFGTHRARNLVFLWSLAGLLFFLVQLLVLLKFGRPNLPYVAKWASDLYWGMAPVGMICFALMTYVNYAAAHDPALDDDEVDDEFGYAHADESWDEDYDEAPEY